MLVAVTPQEEKIMSSARGMLEAAGAQGSAGHHADDFDDAVDMQNEAHELLQIDLEAERERNRALSTSNFCFQRCATMQGCAPGVMIGIGSEIFGTRHFFLGSPPPPLVYTYPGLRPGPHVKMLKPAAWL